MILWQRQYESKGSESFWKFELINDTWHKDLKPNTKLNAIHVLINFGLDKK